MKTKSAATMTLAEIDRLVEASHNEARRLPATGYERALVHMLNGWKTYADAARADLSEKGEEPFVMADDGVLGEHWADMGRALRGLLNGEMGRLDGGRLSSEISQTFEAEGFTSEGLRR